jgi:beta-glucosidase
MNMVPSDYVRFIDTMKRAVAAGEIPRARVEDAVRRILRAKFQLGLFEHPMPDPRFRRTVRSAEHLALAREAVGRSLVLLTNRERTLPIARDAGLIFLTGSGADDIGRQNGGWTLQWQGEAGNTTAGTSIRAALARAVGPNTRVVYDPDGTFATGIGGAAARADVGIVVLAEAPYAEGVGDSPTLALRADDIRKVSLMRERARRVVAVVLSGRPVIIDSILPQADAVVAAWLPGTEGAGVTDALLGAVPFSGKLPYTWPRSIDQLPLNIHSVGDRTGCDGPLFPFGYGLTADQPTPEIPRCGHR